MAVENGQWIMHGLKRNDPACLHSPDEVIKLVNEIGFLPLFANSIVGFSLEERTCPDDWWSGNSKRDPWEWREIIARSRKVAYGKFFEGKAGFISEEFLPLFANARREGYDFDARWDDEKTSLREKKIMDLFMDGGAELFSYEIKKSANLDKGFEGTLTKLQMQTYLCVTDFQQKKNKRGESYGWSIAILTRPEDIWGSVVTSAYGEDPKQSALKIGKRLLELYPDATSKDLKKIIGADTGSGTPARKKDLPSYPQNLLNDVLDPKWYRGDAKMDTGNLSKDQLMGLEFVISRFTELEQEILRLKYQENLTQKAIGEKLGRSGSSVGQILKKAVRRLRISYYMEWIAKGYEITAKKRKKRVNELIEEVKRKKVQYPEKAAFYDDMLEERDIDIDELCESDLLNEDLAEDIQKVIHLVDTGEITPEGYLTWYFGRDDSDDQFDLEF